MNLAFYDVDFWHMPKWRKPNFELMKIYNYHYNNNDRVLMLEKDSKDLQRFSKILYFKDTKGKFLPNHNLSNEKAITYGYGFYGYNAPLQPKYVDSPPSLLAYDPISSKISNSFYEKLKKSSFIRFETRDFTGFNENYKNIYIVDHDILSKPGINEFLHEYHNFNFSFYHPIKCYSIEELKQAEKFFELFNEKVMIEFPYNREIIEKYKNSITYPFMPLSNETEKQFIIRLIKTVLIFKSLKLKYTIPPYYKDSLIQEIIKYSNSTSTESFAQFYKGTDIEKELIKLPSEIRLLLKTKPSQTIEL